MSRSFLFTIDRVHHFQYGQQLGYEGRRTYADICGFRHTFMLKQRMSGIFEEIESVPLNLGRCKIFKSIYTKAQDEQERKQNHHEIEVQSRALAHFVCIHRGVCLFQRLLVFGRFCIRNCDMDGL